MLDHLLIFSQYPTPLQLIKSSSCIRFIRSNKPPFCILDHPNVIAFVSHGGLLGTIEGVTTGTPIVTIPFFGDQFVNARSLALGGTSYQLNFHDMTYEKIVKAIQFVLDPR